LLCRGGLGTAVLRIRDVCGLSILDLRASLACGRRETGGRESEGDGGGQHPEASGEERRARAHHRYSSVGRRVWRMSRCLMGDSGSVTCWRKRTESAGTTFTVPSSSAAPLLMV